MEKRSSLIFTLFILLLIPHLIFGVEVKDFKIAIFWNSGTEIVPYETPVGYEVAAPNTTSAPEIGKSALKLFLSSLDPAVEYDGTTTLDTTNIKEEVRDNSGVVEGASPAILPNARIFDVYDPLTLQDLRNTFNGATPEVIAVINAGGQVDYEPLEQLLYEASLAEIGILLVGSASTSFAVAIDELAEANIGEKFFAVKGIQKAFNVESYKGSLLFDFNLTGDVPGNIAQDSVVMGYENDLHFIQKVSDVVYNSSTDSYTYTEGDTIYMQGGVNDLNGGIVVKHHYGQFVISGAKAQSVIEYDSYDPAMNSGIFYNSAVLGINGSSKLITTEDIIADTILSVSSATKKLISATSEIQEAGTAVAFGDEVPRAWIRVKTGANYGSSVSYKKEETVAIPGTEAYGDGSAYIENSSTDSEFHMYAPNKSNPDEDDATDYTVFYDNDGNKYDEVVEDGGLYIVKTGDTVLVYDYTAPTDWTKNSIIGSFIVDSVKNAPEGYRFTFTDDFKINNSVIYEKGEVFDFVSGYEMRYPAKGYDSLSIDIKNISDSGNTEIFEKIFGSGESNLSGSDSTILFKDWKPNGRIQSAAEIWAVDEDEDIAQFSDWYDGGTFDPTKIYFGRFGQQVARGANEFFYLEENAGTDGFDKTTFDILPDASNTDFADKEYYALSVIQRKHQRLAIVGYEPQFLEDTELSKNILNDIFTWTAIDDSKMPVGKIVISRGSETYNPNDKIHHSVTSLKIIIDYSQKDATVYTDGATVSGGVITQAGDTITVDWDTPTATLSDVANQIDTLVYDITGLIDPTTSIDSLYITGIEISGTALTSTVDSTLFLVVGNVYVDKEIPDVTLIEDATDTTVADLDTVFSVFDNSPLTYTVESTDSSKVIGKLSDDNDLILDVQDDATGVVDIIVTADDGNGNISKDTVTVTLTGVNDAPVVASAIADVIVDEDATDTAHVDLNDIFLDVDGDDLTFSVISSSSNSIVTPIIGDANSVLTLSFGKDANGVDTIIVTASDGTLTVTETFFVTVNAVDEVYDDPYVNDTIPDVIIDEDSDDTTIIDLDSVFSDDNGDKLTYSCESKDSTIVIGIIDTEGVLTLDLQDDGFGTTLVIVTADDGTSQVHDTVVITVNGLEDNPGIIDTIPDVITPDDGGDTTIIDLDDVFDDVDGDTLTYIAISKDSTLVIPIVDEDGNLILDVQDDETGETIVIVIADDGKGDPVSDTILVTVDIAVTPQDEVVDFFWGHIMIPEMFETVITPNPAPASAKSMRFIFSSEEADVVELSLFYATGEKVVESDMVVAWDGTAEFDWDLRNLIGSYRAKSYVAFVLYKKKGRVIATERHMIGLRK